MQEHDELISSTSRCSTGNNNFVWKLLLLLWFVKLFYPEVLIAYYVPALKFTRKLPTLLTIFLFVSWITSKSDKKDGYFWLAFFLFSLVLSGIGAENTGRARLAIRLVLEYYLLARITFTYIDQLYKIRKIFHLFLGSVIYLAAWGVIFFLITGRAMVGWDYILNEEDAYGPLMCIGFAVASSLFLSDADFLKKEKKLVFWAMSLSLIGVILSFARGAFLVFLGVGLLNLKKSGNFFKSFFALIILSVITISATAVFFPDNAFWHEMSTISEGTKSGTGRDRKVLWSLAWEEFKEHPLVGVGPFNFGVVAGDYLDRVPDKRDYRPDTLWGRALHNGFFQILCEGGGVGSFAFLMLLLDFLKQKKKMRLSREMQLGGIGDPYYYGEALFMGIVAFLMNAFFYDIIYYSWLFQMLIIYRVFVNLNHKVIV